MVFKEKAKEIAWKILRNVVDSNAIVVEQRYFDNDDGTGWDIVQICYVYDLKDYQQYFRKYFVKTIYIKEKAFTIAFTCIEKDVEMAIEKYLQNHICCVKTNIYGLKVFIVRKEMI